MITIHLDPKYYSNDKLVIEAKGKGKLISSVKVGSNKLQSMKVSHQDLVNSGKIVFNLI